MYLTRNGCPIYDDFAIAYETEVLRQNKLNKQRMLNKNLEPTGTSSNPAFKFWESDELRVVHEDHFISDLTIAYANFIAGGEPWMRSRENPNRLDLKPRLEALRSETRKSHIYIQKEVKGKKKAA